MSTDHTGFVLRDSAETSSCHQHSSYSFSCSNSWRHVNAQHVSVIDLCQLFTENNKDTQCKVHISLRSVQTESACFRFASKIYSSSQKSFYRLLLVNSVNWLLIPDHTKSKLTLTFIHFSRTTGTSESISEGFLLVF